MKKAPARPPLSARRRGRRAIEYGLLFIGCVVFVDALVGDKGLLESIKKGREFNRLEQSITAVRADNQRLREQAERLRTDPAAIEEMARKELGLMKPGEHLFILKDRTKPERPEKPD